MPNSRIQAIRADWICPVASPPVPDGAVLIDGTRIVDVVATVPDGISVESFDGCAILPGFVNTHIHLELTVLRGFLENLPFFEWIRRLTRAKYDHLSDEDLRISAELGALECLRAGVTTVGEVTDVGAGWNAMTRSGLRGVAYQEVFGPAEASASEALEALEEKVDTLRHQASPTCRIGVSPHAPFTVSAGLYQQVRRYAARENLPIAVHLAESAAEGEFVRKGTGPFAEFLKVRGIPVSARGMTPIAYLDSLEVLGTGTLVIHAIDCDADDVARLKKNGVGIAHCPKSNLKLGHQIAPLKEFLESNIAVGLGTDSVASNNAVDMFEEMRTAAFLQRTRAGNSIDSMPISASEALHLATLGGARALGMEKDVGSLERGKLADMAVVDLNDPALQPVYDPVATMVYSANRNNVVATFLGGRRVDRDASELVSRAATIAARLKNISW